MLVGLRHIRVVPCRSVQWEILPDYGFEQSEEGIEAMLWAFKKLKDDAWHNVFGMSRSSKAR